MWVYTIVDICIALNKTIQPCHKHKISIIFFAGRFVTAGLGKFRQTQMAEVLGSCYLTKL